MFFPYVQLTEVFAAVIAVLAASCAGIWFVRKQRNLLRIPIIVLSSPVALLAGLFLVLQVLLLGCETYSPLLYSPDHSKAVRTTTDDEGAVGGHTQVELLTHHGLSVVEIYQGFWKSVDMKDVQWLDANHIQIKYDFENRNYTCDSVDGVQVDCVSLPPPPDSGARKSPSGYTSAHFLTAKDGSYNGTDAVVLSGQSGSAFVYVGRPTSVVWNETQWKDDRTLEVVYRDAAATCDSQLDITVVCTLKAAR